MSEKTKPKKNPLGACVELDERQSEAFERWKSTVEERQSSTEHLLWMIVEKLCAIHEQLKTEVVTRDKFR